MIEEGERRGELLASYKILLRQVRQLFGIPDAAIEAKLTAITDLERLERLAEPIFTAKSWQELLATP